MSTKALAVYRHRHRLAQLRIIEGSGFRVMSRFGAKLVGAISQIALGICGFDPLHVRRRDLIQGKVMSN